MMRTHAETLPDVVLGGVPLTPGRVVRLDAWLAVDRTDRLEILVALPGSSRSEVRDLLSAGTPISVAVPSRATGANPFAPSGTALFDGLVERHRFEWSAHGGATLRIVAFAAHHRLRARARDRVFLHATDSEVAVAIASSLELVAVVDPTAEVHAVRRLSGDPLVFLRALARDNGYELAVTRDRLYFVAQSPWEETVRFTGPVEIVEASVEDRRDGLGPRGGTVTVLGTPACLPLRFAVLAGIDGRADGTYRIVRALHRWEPAAYRVTLEVLESGLDLEAWARVAPCGPRGEISGELHGH